MMTQARKPARFAPEYRIERTTPMRRSRPSLTVFIASFVCGVLALLPLVGVNLVALPVTSFGWMTIAWVLLIAGVLVPRL